MSAICAVLIQDSATGRSYRIPSDRLREYSVASDESSCLPGTVLFVLPTDNLVEELPMARRAMLQAG